MLYEPNNALIAQQMAAKQMAAQQMVARDIAARAAAAAPVPPRSDWRAETVQLNNREEYGRLTQHHDHHRRQAQASVFIDVLSGIVGNFQQVAAEQERVYRQERCE